jgi:PilZ domain
MGITRSEFVWATTAATFLAVVLIPTLAYCVIRIIRVNWGLEEAVPRHSDRRRSKRFDVSLRVFVYGHQGDEEPFCEEATVLQVSAHGGLLALATRVPVGQQLLLSTNGAEEVHQPCWVARVGASTGVRTEAAIRFARPAPEFWLAQSRQNQVKSETAKVAKVV